MSLIQKKLQPFSLQAYDDQQFITVTDQDLIGQWSVLVFYPNDFTFVCPTELGELADLHEQFIHEGAKVYAVSTDSHFVHKAWHDSSAQVGKVNYPLIGDPSAQLAKDLDILVEADWQALRGSFILNPEGKIVAYEIHDMGIGRDFNELLRKLQAAKFIAENPGVVCPVGWKPGGSTLKPSYDLVGKI